MANINFVLHLLGLLPNNFECGKNDNGRTGEFITGSPNDQGKYYLQKFQMKNF